MLIYHDGATNNYSNAMLFLENLVPWDKFLLSCKVWRISDQLAINILQVFTMNNHEQIFKLNFYGSLFSYCWLCFLRWLRYHAGMHIYISERPFLMINEGDNELKLYLTYRWWSLFCCKPFTNQNTLSNFYTLHLK